MTQLEVELKSSMQDPYPILISVFGINASLSMASSISLEENMGLCLEKSQSLPVQSILTMDIPHAHDETSGRNKSMFQFP